MEKKKLPLTKKEGYLNQTFRYPAIQANYLINVSNKNKYIYIETPKTACSTIKKTLQKIEIEGTKEVLDNDVHNKRMSPLKSPLQLEKPLSYYLDSYTKFGFVRNPYTRLLSCYLDKIVGPKWEKRFRLPQLGFDPEVELSFIQFLSAVKNQNVHDMDIHWLPQSEILAKDKIDLDFIGKQEYFTQDFSNILSHLFGNKKIEITSVRGHSVSATKKLKKYLSKRAIQLIQEIYYNDFKTFGYGFHPPID